MASTARSRPSAAVSRQSSRPVNLPPYQPLTHKLNLPAEHALRNLPTTHSLNDLKRRLQTAVNHLTEVTGDLNDQYERKKADHEKLKARRAARARDPDRSQGGDTNDDEGDQVMEYAWRQVDQWTTKMDEATQKAIDVQARVDDGEKALRELNSNISQGRTATQSTLGASQHRPRRQRRRRNDDDDDDEEENESGDDQENTQAEDTHTDPSPFTAFKTKIADSESTYASLSSKDRYASHNDYIGFRKIVHDARHPNDDTPLPHPSTWFPSSDPNSNGHTAADRHQSRSASAADPQASDSDADIQIAREKRSIRCPLTLLPMHEPLTSTLCPHSFEKSAILGMLDASTVKSTDGQKAMKCPECEVMLTALTLRQDHVLVRKIRRIEEQERRERERDGSDEDDDVVDGDVRAPVRRRVEEVTSSPVRSRGQVVDLAAVKKERASQMQQRARASREPSMVPATQIVDMEGDVGEETQ
ncbi:MAG: hypothetical protein Q9208_005223 [Pyrenodesmia sp. 3 TL-2023]